MPKPKRLSGAEVVAAFHRLDIGTLREIVRQAGRYLSESEIAHAFYTEE
jgi:hypothetical protein